MTTDDRIDASVAAAIADSLGERETLETWLQERPNLDYGAARADGGDPAQLLLIMELAGQCYNFALIHGVALLSGATSAITLYRELAPHLNERRTDFTPEEMRQAVQSGVEAALGAIQRSTPK